MKHTAVIFPGQGAQYTGMGKDFYDTFKESRAIYDLACDVTGLDIGGLCFEKNEDLNITEYTQIALLTTELAMLAAVKSLGARPTVSAGLSLGEYAALVASEKISPREAMAVVRQRGIFMQEAVPHGGAMAAVMGLDGATVEKVCAGVAGIVEPANFNCPGQVVISGELQAVTDAGQQLLAAGAKRVMPLKVSGPFHSSMLQGAGARLKAVLEPVILMDSDIPYVSNTTGTYVNEISDIKPLLVRQVSSSVRWEQSIRTMLAEGVNTFVEIGPGQTLAGFMKRIDRSVKMINIEKVQDLEKLEL